MLSPKTNQLNLQTIANSICKEGLCNRPQLLLAIWEAAKKVIANNSQHAKSTLLANCFYSKSNKQLGKFYYSLQPTDSLLRDCGLKYRSQIREHQSSVIPVTEINLYKSMASPQKEYFKNDKELVIRFFYFIINKIRELIKQNKSIEICLEQFGSIRINERTFFFEPHINVDTGSSSSPNLFKLKRSSRSKKENSSFDKTDQSKLINKFQDSINEDMNGSRIKKRPYFHQVIVYNQPTNTKICNDLLGAGIDPLTYSYQYSKMIDQPKNLISQDFLKPEHSTGRFPCVIDKFSRTKGAQLTGVKVGNSIVVRIAGNYSPNVRNYFIDIKTKSIQYVVPETKIKLESSKQLTIQPASEGEEYSYLLGSKSKQLQSRVELRRQIYQRYCEYYTNNIPNDCVAILERSSIERIIKQVKSLVKKIGKKDGSPLINNLMVEVNKEYYLAYKKSVLDYILKDKSEMFRTGINLIFSTVSEWGKPVHSQSLVFASSEINLKQLKRNLQLNHILYPECLNKIYHQNQKISHIQLFKKRKEGEYRPYNILYYIKRNTNQLKESYSLLCDSWAKKISTIIEQSIDLKQENYQKLKQFFNAIHIIMANKLKEVIYNTIEDIINEFNMQEGGDKDQQLCKNLLIINLSEENEKITFIDDIEKVFQFQLLDIVHKIIDTTKQIPRVQHFLKMGSDLFIWGVDQNDNYLLTTQNKLKTIIYRNYEQVQALKSTLSHFQKIFLLREQVNVWCRENFNVQCLNDKFRLIENYQLEVYNISFYYKVGMVIVDCIELKKKLISQLRNIKKMLFETTEQRIKAKNQYILGRINSYIQLVCKNVLTTSQFVQLAHDIQKIKHEEMQQIKIQIDLNLKDIMYVFNIEGFSANFELIKSSYMCKHYYEQLFSQVTTNEKRLFEERLELEKKLREKINLFQAETLSSLKEINSKIDTFDMRKLYTEYLGILAGYKNKVQNNKQIQKQFNSQEEDLKWTTTVFANAKELESIVQPNYQLWQLVSQFDTCIKEWKYIELSRFDIQNAEKKIGLIDAKITKLIGKLKNFSGLKTVYDLQNDVKEFLGQQVSIIKIFSNAGLKERHWNLFNKRMPLSGYDLKELTYGRIKMLYEYEKNLKILMSISNQAAKQFQIENEKQEMFEYWNRLSFRLNHASDENIIFINQEFLDEQIEVVEYQITKTVILKNSPFSKALVTLLTEWENWLINAKKILSGFRSSQEKFKIVRSIFKMDEISKLLPIESTEFDSIENIWKSVIKKILQQPKITEFFKSQKIPDIIEQIGKKADFIKNSFNSYLNLKRSEFNRMYFMPEQNVLHLIELLACDELQPALQYIFWSCFNGVSRSSKNDSSSLLIGGLCDSLIIKCEISASKKGKSKFFQQLIYLQKNLREAIKLQIKQLGSCEEILENVEKKYTLSSIFAALQLEFSLLIKSSPNIGHLQSKYQNIKHSLTQSLRKTAHLKQQILLQKIIFMEQRCHQLKLKDTVQNLQQIPLFHNLSDELEIRFLGLSIKYHYEYVGDQVTTYIPLSSDRLIWHIAYSIHSQTGLVCDYRQSIKEIAHFTGQYFAEVNNTLHIQQNNFESCVIGTVCTNYWIHFDDRVLSMTFDMLSKLTEIYQLKKEKADLKISTVAFRNNELNINKQTALFLSILPHRQRQIPEGLLTCTRSISLIKPPLFAIKELVKEKNKLNVLKNYVCILKYECKNIDAAKILSATETQKDLSKCIQTVKTMIWGQLQHEQQVQFLQLFGPQIENKEEQESKSIENYIKEKEGQINYGLDWADLILVVGEQAGKSTIIKNTLSSRQVNALYDQNKGINLNFIEEGVSELSYVTYLQKAKTKMLKQHQNIYLYIDCDLNSEQIEAIKKFINMHSLSNEHERELKAIVEMNSLADIDPSIISHACIVNVHELCWQSCEVYKKWIQQLSICSQNRLVILQLESAFESLLKLVIRMEKRPFNDSKFSLAKRFFSYFEIFLNNLGSKQVERMCDTEKESYIFNSFVYCIYWAFGVSSLRSNQVEVLKKQIKQLFSDRLELPRELQDIYLNEENEWVYWQNLKEQFVAEKQNLPFYQVWVPTASNTKMLTMLVKLVQSNHSVIICGSESGKSTLLNELSSFELSYNSFLIDCHKNTSPNHITHLARGRILYGEFKKNLILVDDLHLPAPSVSGILRSLIERGYSLNSSLIGKLNENLWQPSILATWNGIQPSRCFWRLFNKTIPIQLQKYEFKQLESILKTYLNCLIPSSEAYSNFFRLESVIVNYCIHTMKVFPKIEPHHLRILIESICRLNIEQDQKLILEHLLVETYLVIQQLVPNQELNHFFRHMSHYYSKLLSIQLKNYSELRQIVQTYFYDLKNDKQNKQAKSTVQEVALWMEQKLKEKNTEYYLTHFQVKIIQRVAWIIKNNNSHIIMLSSISSGCRVMAKLAGWLVGITVNQLMNINVSGVLEDVVKVLKTGGKIDESINIISQELICSHPSLVKLINSLIFSPQFHECFGQILMEQIIKSFNSEKKFLKKNVKKSELIKKIREKFNSIYHFCLCIDQQQFKALLQEYPKFAALRVLEVGQWPTEALLTVSKKFIPERTQQTMKVVFRIEEEIRVKWESVSLKMAKTNLLSILNLLGKVEKLLSTRTSNLEQSDELWSKRVKASNQKIQSLKRQKIVYEVQHSQHFSQIKHINQQISNHNNELQNVRRLALQAEKELQMVKAECSSLKIQCQQAESELESELSTEYHNYVENNKVGLLSAAQKFQNDEVFNQIVSSYEYSIHEISSSITQLAYELQKDYFLKVRDLNCQHLGCFANLVRQFRQKMLLQWQRQTELSQQFNSFTIVEAKYLEYEHKCREIEDKISDLGDELSAFKDSKESISQGYQQINDKILQNEAIINVLRNFEHVLRFKNDVNAPTPKHIRGNAILMTYLLAYLPLLPQHDISDFSSTVVSILAQSSVDVSCEEFLSFFSQEKQFELIFKYRTKVDDWIKLLAYQSNDLCIVAVGKVKQISAWITRFGQFQNTIWLKEVEDLRDSLQKNNIIYIHKPNKALFEKLIYLLLRPISLKNNAKNMIVDDEDINIHDQCRVIFIFESWDQIPFELLTRNYFFLIFSDQQIRNIESVIEDKMIRQSGFQSRQMLVQRYLKMRGEIAVLNQKLHAIIMKMKRENMMSQLVFKKIQQEGESKGMLEAEMRRIKAELSQLQKQIEPYQSFVQQLGSIYGKYKHRVACSTFTRLLQIVLQPIQLREIKGVTAAVQNFFAILVENKMAVNQTEQFAVLMVKLITTERVVLTMSDLSNGYEFVHLLLHENNFEINRFLSSDLIATALKDNMVNLVAISRNQEVHALAHFYSNHAEKINKTNIVLLLLDHLQLLPQLQQTSLIVPFQNLKNYLLAHFQRKYSKSHIIPPVNHSHLQLRAYQHLHDYRQLLSNKEKASGNLLRESLYLNQ